MQKTPNIGFIGIGVMGAPMATHLAQAGYHLTVHDLNRQNAEQLASRFGAMTVAETPKAVAEQSDIVITMLPSGEYVRAVALGEQGLLHGFKRDALLLDTSSSEPWLTAATAQALAARQIAMVDAPVSGARAGAEAAELVFMVGGDHESVARVMPVLRVIGKEIFHLGPVGAGHTMKCINNTITAMTFLATTEGLVLGKKAGLDPDVMTDVLNHSTGMSWISRTHIKQRIASRKFDDPFRLELMLKDIGIAAKLAQDLNVSLPLSAKGLDLWREANSHAGSGASVSELVRWVERLTNTEITPGSALG
ncbi:MAG: 6-phosphogluconate dehydrogenase [Gammaproteobacteria bacterium]|nr:6-phosphogluconate dehydrogenase [Gammaproteobacteria bacterium]